MPTVAHRPRPLDPHVRDLRHPWRAVPLAYATLESAYLNDVEFALDDVARGGLGVGVRSLDARGGRKQRWTLTRVDRR